MKPALLKLTVPVAALALAAACIIFPHPGDDEGWRRIPDRSSEPSSSSRPASSPAAWGAEVLETVDFAPGWTLTLENDYGRVEITGWDRDAAEILARSADTASSRPSSARISRVERTRPNVEIREVRGGILVRTPTFEGPGEPPVVNYEIRVPRDVVLSGIRISEGNLTISDVYGRIEASVDKGDLAVVNYSGRIDAKIGTGNADIEVLDLRETDAITVTSRQGDIVLRLESGAGAIVEADAPRGEVQSDFDLGVRLPAATVKGWIGQGGPTVILRASDGRIDLRAVR